MTKIKFVLVFLVVLIVATFVIRPYYNFLTQTLKISPIKAIFSDGDLQTVNNTINILLLGIPGENHEGPYLSDSINVIHYNLDTNKITVIGIPRDIWSDTLQDKINSAYSYGEVKQKGGGLKLAKAEVAGIIGMPISYGVVISFDRFEELIDYLGGIDIQVEQSFTDNEYPVAGSEADDCNGDPDLACRYQTVSFQKGLTHMDGATALKFVRSRHAEGTEGSDFARNKRQQLVMNTIKDALIKKIKTLNVRTHTELYIELNKLVERDISNQQAAILVRNAVFKKNLTQNNIQLPTGLFEVPYADDYYGKYVLIPAGNDPEVIKSYVKCVIEKEEKECINE